MDGDVPEDADRDAADGGERQHVVADEKRDKDALRRLHGDREAGVPRSEAVLKHLVSVSRQYRCVDDRHADPDGADCQQNVASSSQPASRGNSSRTF